MFYPMLVWFYFQHKIFNLQVERRLFWVGIWYLALGSEGRSLESKIFLEDFHSNFPVRHQRIWMLHLGSTLAGASKLGVSEVRQLQGWDPLRSLKLFQETQW